MLSRTNKVFVSYVFKSDDTNLQAGFPFKMKYTTYTCDRQCNNGLCLHPSWWCDGLDQCGDNTDEIGCSDPVPDCDAYRRHMVATWVLGLSIVVVFIVAVVATLLALFYIRKYRGRYGGDRSLLVQED
ncbi:uncharacterized protein [Amphiura filiformis]|uniref:uncharacterized protein n=1 Tax=Amphiura filiformis TaxID=82378 RepID=UPI003B22864D